MARPKRELGLQNPHERVKQVARQQMAELGTAGLSLRDAQARLNELGYNAGTPDGAMGGKTASALRAFQKDRGIAQSGRLDAATMVELSK